MIGDMQDAIRLAVAFAGAALVGAAIGALTLVAQGYQP